MLYCPLLSCAGPIAIARGIPAVVLKPAKLQKTKAALVVLSSGHLREVRRVTKLDTMRKYLGCIASARHFTACGFFCGPRRVQRERWISDVIKTNEMVLNRWTYRLSSKSTSTSRQFL